VTPGAILDTLKAHGVRLTRDGGDLIATPKAALTDELRAMIRANKPELLEALAIDSARHWRWLFHYLDGEEIEFRILPEPNEEELRTRYPGVVRFEPLPDTLQ
jgi:tubulysin polyketide synthase-like protein